MGTICLHRHVFQRRARRIAAGGNYQPRNVVRQLQRNLHYPKNITGRMASIHRTTWPDSRAPTGMALFLAAELGAWIRFSNDVIEQRHEAEVHVQLLVAVEEGCARIVGDEVD